VHIPRLDLGRFSQYFRAAYVSFFLQLGRLTQNVLGLANVKEACLFPRDRKRVRP
jgi:aspartyl/asparaginyl-tRNA synthetase